MRSADVAVVGAGPAGCAAAITLARGGRQVALLDRARFPRDKCCGDGLTAGALRRLRRLGLEAPAVSSWTEIAEVLVRSPSGRVCRFPFPSGPEAAAAVARRLDLDAALVELARAEGVTVLEGHRVTGVDEAGHRMTLHVEGEGSLAAPYVIGADGMWSPLRKATGPVGEAGYLGEWHAFRQYWRTPGQPDNQMWVWFEPELLPGYAWSFPVGRGVANVGFGVLRRAEHGAPRGRFFAAGDGRPRTWRRDGEREGPARWPTGQDVARLREVVLGQPHVLEVLGAGAQPDQTPRTWPIPARLSTTALAGGGGRVLFAGDAARAPDPMTGEGIAQALETGELAARAVMAAGPGDPAAAARAYRRSVRGGLSFDDQLARLLAVALRSPTSARAAVRLAGSTPWISRQFGRWLFEDYPRAYLATPWRWQRGALARPGAYNQGSAASRSNHG